MELAPPGPPSRSTEEAGPALSARRLTKSFGDTVVLSKVDLDLMPGSVHGLLGENGAGKSTLIKLLAGIYKQDSGSIVSQGQEVTPGSPAPSVAFIHQDLGLDREMTVAENVALVAGYPRRWGVISWNAVRHQAARALETFDLDLPADQLVSNLSAVERSLVAIARALSINARVVVLDEPTAALPQPDVERLFTVVRRLRQEGTSFLYVSHRINEIFQICDRVLVLRDGYAVAEGAVEAFSRMDLVEAIVGRDGVDVPAPGHVTRIACPAAPPVFSARGLAVGQIGPVDVEACSGEVLGLFGLAGSGQVQIGRALVGAVSRDQGQMVLMGRPFSPRSPVEAVGKGVIGFVAGDRIGESIAAGLTVQENLYLNPGAQRRPTLRPIGHRDERRRALRAMHRFDVRPLLPAHPIQLLSGGNQQKVAVARWIEADVNLLVLEDPTAGVDIGARAQLHRFLRATAEHGACVILISSDSEEVVSVCDRVYVMGGGKVVRELDGPELTEHLLLSAANSAGQRAMTRSPRYAPQVR